MKKGIDYPGISLSFFCHDGRGNYVMARRSKKCRDEHGCWDFGGGALEFGETVHDTLKKEIKEEYGANIIDQEFLGYRDVFRIDQNANKTHWLGLYFKVLVDPSEIKNGEPEKFDEMGWFTIKKLPSPLHSQIKFVLEIFKEKLI